VKSEVRRSSSFFFLPQNHWAGGLEWKPRAFGAIERDWRATARVLLTGWAEEDWENVEAAVTGNRGQFRV